MGVDTFDPGIQYLKCRHHKIRGIEHIEHRAMRSRKSLLHDEGKLCFDPGSDKAFRWHQTTIVKEHVVEENAGIRLIDVERALHCLRSQPDLVTFHHAALRNLDLDPLLLDPVGVFDGDGRIFERNLTDLLAGFLGLVEPFSCGGNVDLREGHANDLQSWDKCNVAHSIAEWKSVRRSLKRNLLAKNKASRPFTDHHGWSVGVAGNEARHN